MFYVRTFQRYDDFWGRATREEYWIFLLSSSIIAPVLFFFEIILEYFGVIPELDLGVFPELGFLTWAYFLVLLIPSTSVGVRRLHDTGRSGWWLLVPIVSFFFLLTASNRGRNRYGPHPNSYLDGMSPEMRKKAEISDSESEHIRK